MYTQKTKLLHTQETKLLHTQIAKLLHTQKAKPLDTQEAKFLHTQEAKLGNYPNIINWGLLMGNKYYLCNRNCYVTWVVLPEPVFPPL